MSKQDEAGLILQLYELRREEKMRKAREWYFREFNPRNIEDFTKEMFGENSAYLRMVVTYWEMAAALVNNSAIDLQLFNDTNGECWGVFAKFEPILGDIRSGFAPNFAAQIEKLVDATPDGRQLTAGIRERTQAVRAEMTARRQEAAVKA